MTKSNVTLITVSGSHNSGKTTAIEKIIRKLTEISGVDVATVKDIQHDAFQMDQEGKDTWRHAKAGAKVIVARSTKETDFIVKNHMSLNEIIGYIEADIIIAEGFKHEGGYKILIAKDADDFNSTIKSLPLNSVVLAIGGPVVNQENFAVPYFILKDEKDYTRLCNEILSIHQKIKVKSNRLSMPLDAMACTLNVNGNEIVMKDFVGQTLKNIIVGIISSLTWNVKNKVKIINVKVKPMNDEDNTNESVNIKINDKIIKIKAFVQDYISKVIIAFVSTLNLPKGESSKQLNSIQVIIK
ncbi:MAG: molybdopterin-guanine dinucleotide biosynthesis protein B [Promethearchaeota archaeon]